MKTEQREREVMEAKDAYKKGWDASKRSKTYDLDAAEERFIDRYGWDLSDDFTRGWCDFSAGKDYTPIEPKRGARTLCRCGGVLMYDNGAWYHDSEKVCRDGAPMVKSKLPKELLKADAWYDDADEAMNLWCDGFRPMEARKLEPMMLVAYHETDVFQLGTVGPVRATLIGDVVHEDGMVVCSTSDRGDVETDECAEVWAKDGRV